MKHITAPAAIVALFIFPTTHAADPPAPIIDMHLHALPIADFVQLGGPAPIPHCVPMTDYPVAGSGEDVSKNFRSRDLKCHAAWSPVTDDEVRERTLASARRRSDPCEETRRSRRGDDSASADLVPIS